MTIISASRSVPTASLLAKGGVDHIDYVDSFSFSLPPLAPPPPVDELTVRMLGDLPGWVKFLLRVRDGMVAVFHLKRASGPYPQDSKLPLQAGDRLGLFSVTARRTSEGSDEILLDLDDRHLLCRIAGLRAPDTNGEQRFAVTTIVEFHNLLGRLYFLPVRPFHRLITPALMRPLARALEDRTATSIPANHVRRKPIGR